MTFSRQQPSPRYLELLGLYRRMHEEGDRRTGVPAEATFDGRSLAPQAERLAGLIRKTAARTLLDYGSGKGKLHSGGLMHQRWNVEAITCYDPAYAPNAVLPAGRFDGVLCTDVLEHCPHEDMEWIVGELFGFADKFVFASVAGYPARKILPNGENAHITIRPTEYWFDLFTRSNARKIPMEVWVYYPAYTDRIANFPPLAEAQSHRVL